MALPHLGPPFTSRKNIYEAVIVTKRNRESAFRQQWQNNAKFFNDYDVHATKQKAWESDASFHSSMDAWKAQQQKDQRKKQLEMRRKALALLVRNETAQYQQELTKKNLGIKTTDYMRERAENLRSAREEQRVETARQKLYDHWRSNNPDIRQLESRQEEQHVISQWKDQLEEQKQRADQERMEMERLEQEMEENRLMALRLEREKEEEKLEEEKQLKGVLRAQMDELRQKELETEQYKLEQDKLERNQLELEQMKEQQRLREKERLQKEHGRILLRQHTAALRRKSQLIKRELEEDKKFLEELIKQEEEEMRLNSARREEARADANWMKQVIEEQMRVEQAREAELDMLYQDEAAKVWQQREDEWSREREARMKLLQQVLVERQNQVQSKMDDLNLRHQESLERREELLREMDLANQLTKRDLDEDEERKKQRKKELMEQITARKTARQIEELRLQEEDEEAHAEEADYKDLLREEAQRLGVQGHQRKDFRRKQAWY